MSDDMFAGLQMTNAKSGATDVAVITGSCLCGAVEFEVQDRFAYMGYCHCKDCQKQTGSAFTMTGAVRRQDLCVTKGESQITAFAKSAGTTLNFCKCCGSQLFALKPLRGACHVRIGALSSAPSLGPMGHMYVDSKASWFTIGDDLPQFPGTPPALNAAVIDGSSMGPLLGASPV